MTVIYLPIELCIIFCIFVLFSVYYSSLIRLNIHKKKPSLLLQRRKAELLYCFFHELYPRPVLIVGYCKAERLFSALLSVHNGIMPPSTSAVIVLK